jgi:hypothetical protein
MNMNSGLTTSKILKILLTAVTFFLSQNLYFKLVSHEFPEEFLKETFHLAFFNFLKQFSDKTSLINNCSNLSRQKKFSYYLSVKNFSLEK